MYLLHAFIQSDLQMRTMKTNKSDNTQVLS